MDIHKINYFERVEHERHQDFIEANSLCALCGTVLELTHYKDEKGGEIKEEARCPECSIRTRAKIYSIN